MNRQQIGLMLVLKHLGIPLSLRSFDERLIVQKTTYLAQEAGANLGYHFKWYVKGPYCSDAASDGFAIIAELKEGSDEAKTWKLDDKTSRILERLSSLFRPKPSARILELLASVHFLLTRKQVASAPDQIRTVLAKHGKHFTVPEISRALEQLNSHGLLKSSSASGHDK